MPPFYGCTGLVNRFKKSGQIQTERFPATLEGIKILQNLPEENLDDELGDAGTGGTGFPDPVTRLTPEDYPLSDLNSIRFHEDWYINPGNLQIYKDVRGITINRHESLIDNYTGDFIQGSVKSLFTVWFH